MIYNKEIEKLPKSKLRKLQSERFVKLVNYMYKNQSFYKKSWDKAGINLKKIKSIEDIHKFPVTKKKHLRDNYPFGLFAVPQNEVNRIHCSSGSTGKPTVVSYTKEDLKVFSDVVARSLCCAGAKPGMMIQNAYGYGLFTGGLGVHYGAEKLGMSVLPVSGGMTDRQIMLLKDFQPEMLTCTPSYALTLVDEIYRKGYTPKDFNLKYAVLGAEPWTESVRKEVEESLGIIATNIYGLSEIIGPGVSQEDYEEKNGSHIWEDHFFPEIIDPKSGEVLPEGEEGILVLTTLTKRAMPLMRYKTNDICSLFYDSDSKRTHIKMSPIVGRYDDMLIIRGVNLFHTQVEALLEEMPEFTNDYQLLVTRQGRMDSVELKVELNDSIYKRTGAHFEQVLEQIDYLRMLKAHLQKKIKENIGLSMAVTFADKDSLPKSDGGKLKRIIDERRITKALS